MSLRRLLGVFICLMSQFCALCCLDVFVFLCVSIRMNIRIKIREDIDAPYVMICNGGSSHIYFHHVVFFQLEIVYKHTF